MLRRCRHWGWQRRTPVGFGPYPWPDTLLISSSQTEAASAPLPALPPCATHPAVLGRCSGAGWHSGLGPQQSAFLPFPCRIRGVEAGRRGHKDCPRVRRAFLGFMVGLGAPSLKAVGVRG